MERHQLADLLARRAGTGKAYLEFLRSDALSVGLYVLPAGGVDGQLPHTEDEIYVVMSGRSRFTAGADVREAVPGDVIYVAKGVPHRFHDITEEMQLIVVFAPPESAR